MHKFYKFEKFFNSKYDKYEKKIESVDKFFFKNALLEMQAIRNIEFLLAEKKKSGFIKGPIHLSVGQEAGPVVISNFLKKGDLVYGNHRSHAHILSLKCNILKFLSEITCRSNGLSYGFGGSMHLRDINNGFAASVPIVSGTIAIAAGSALALKKLKKKNISISYFGDSAVEEGVFHETLNFSTMFNLPILFVVENNSMASHLHISKRQPSLLTSRFALANKINFKICDGNDVVSLKKSASDLINYIRKYNKPAFLELITYRWLGHVDWREDLDVGVNRKKIDIIRWKRKDPILRLENILRKNKFINDNYLPKFKLKHEKYIKKIWEQSMKEKFPSVKSYKKIYE